MARCLYCTVIPTQSHLVAVEVFQKNSLTQSQMCNLNTLSLLKYLYLHWDFWFVALCYIWKNNLWPRLFYKSNSGRIEFLMYLTTKALMTCNWQNPPTQNDSCLFESILHSSFQNTRASEKGARSALLWRSAFPDTTLSAHAARERLTFTNWVKSPQLVLPSSYWLRYRLSLLLLFIPSAGWISITMPGVIVVLALESWGCRKNLNLW